NWGNNRLGTLLTSSSAEIDFQKILEFPITLALILFLTLGLSFYALYFEIKRKVVEPLVRVADRFSPKTVGLRLDVSDAAISSEKELIDIGNLRSTLQRYFED